MHVTNLAIFYWLSAYELLMSLRRLVDSLDHIYDKIPKLLERYE